MVAAAGAVVMLANQEGLVDLVVAEVVVMLYHQEV